MKDSSVLFMIGVIQSLLALYVEASMVTIYLGLSGSMAMCSSFVIQAIERKL